MISWVDVHAFAKSEQQLSASEPTESSFLHKFLKAVVSYCLKCP